MYPDALCDLPPIEALSLKWIIMEVNTDLLLVYFGIIYNSLSDEHI